MQLLEDFDSGLLCTNLNGQWGDARLVQLPSP